MSYNKGSSMGTYTKELLLVSLLLGGIGLHAAQTQSLTSRKLGLMSGLNHGKMWPKQKALLRRQEINTMNKKISSFPSQAKRERLQTIQNRIEALEQMGEEENL